MYEISSRIYECFNKFNEENLKGITGEEKEKAVIKEHYWVDMLEGIYNISNDYVNVQWKIENQDEEIKMEEQKEQSKVEETETKNVE